MSTASAREPVPARGPLLRIVGGPAECVAVAGVMGLAALVLGAFELPRRAWAVPLWSHHPFGLAAPAALAALLLCLAPVRERVLRWASRAAAWHPPGGVRSLLWLGLVAVLFGLRERRLLGDSTILLHATRDQPFHLPDVGATWIFHGLAESGAALGLGRLPAIQLGLCVAGAATVACLWGLARATHPSRGRALGFVAIVLCGGLLRVLAGHVEVYALVLLAAAGFLWSGCACLAGRAPLWLPGLALGLGLWLHPSFLFLVPAAPLLLAARPRASHVALALAAVAAPFTLFAGATLVLGGAAEAARAWEALLAIARGSEGNGGRWLSPPFSAGGEGTRWAVLSAPHLRYLASCAFLLLPAALPLGAGLSLARRVDPASAATRFLGVAAAGSLVYPLLLRPIWGPYDWDLFSLTAFCVACLAAHRWTRWRAPEAGSLALLLAGAALLLVGLPLWGLGWGAAHPVGPLALEQLTVLPGESLWQAVDRTIRPWL